MPRDRRRRLPLLLAVGATALTVAACTTVVPGDGRRVAGARPSASPSASASPVTVDAGMIVLHARNAMGGRSLAVHGRHMEHGTVVTVDIATGWDAADSHEVGTAAVQVAGVGLSIRGVGNDTWVEAPAAYWQAAGVPEATAKQLDGKWIVAPPGDTSGLTDLVNSVGVTDFLLPANDADLTRVGSDVVDGTTVDVLKDRSTGDRFLITTGDQPLLLQVVSTIGRLDVSYPDTVPSVSAPDPSEIVTLPGD